MGICEYARPSTDLKRHYHISQQLISATQEQQSTSFQSVLSKCSSPQRRERSQMSRSSASSIIRLQILHYKVGSTYTSLLYWSRVFGYMYFWIFIFWHLLTLTLTWHSESRQTHDEDSHLPKLRLNDVTLSLQLTSHDANKENKLHLNCCDWKWWANITGASFTEWHVSSTWDWRRHMSGPGGTVSGGLSTFLVFSSADIYITTQEQHLSASGQSGACLHIDLRLWCHQVRGMNLTNQPLTWKVSTRHKGPAICLVQKSTSESGQLQSPVLIQEGSVLEETWFWSC